MKLTNDDPNCEYNIAVTAVADTLVLFFIYNINRDKSWLKVQVSDCKLFNTVNAVVGSMPTRGSKIFIKMYIFIFRSGVEVKRGVEFHHSIRNTC